MYRWYVCMPIKLLFNVHNRYTSASNEILIRYNKIFNLVIIKCIEIHSPNNQSDRHTFTTPSLLLDSSNEWYSLRTICKSITASSCAGANIRLGVVDDDPDDPDDLDDLDEPAAPAAPGNGTAWHSVNFEQLVSLCDVMLEAKELPLARMWSEEEGVVLIF